MIEDIDVSLRALIRRDVLSRRAHADVSFEVPTSEWAGELQAPTINLYLYGIHEEEQATVGLDELLEGYGAPARYPGRRLTLSYLVTVWADGAEDEHRLLSALLACFLGHEVLPTEVLTHRLRLHPSPCELRVNLPAAQRRGPPAASLARVGELKPSVDLAVVAPVSLAVAPRADIDYVPPAALLSG